MPPENITSTVTPTSEIPVSPPTPKNNFPFLPVMLAIVVIAVITGAYFFYITTTASIKENPSVTQVLPTLSPPSPTNIPSITNSTDSATIQKELDQTTVNSLDADFQQLDASASQL